MHEMRRSEAVQHHSHRHVDGKREVYAAHKINDKEHQKGSSSQISKSDRDHRGKQHAVTSQIPGALRICGDWSEHLSSNGKVYFFNNKTKSSQWERPKEWSSSRAVEVKKDKSKSSNLHNKVVSKHSSDGSSTASQQHSSRQYKSHSSVETKAGQVQQHSRHRAGDAEGSRDRDYRTLSSNPSAKDRDYRDIDYRDANSSRSADSRLSNNTDTHSQHRVDRDYRSSGVSQHDRPSSRRPGQGANSRLGSQDYNGKHSAALSNDAHYSSRHSEVTSDSKSSSVDGARVRSREGGSHSSNSTPRSATDASKRDWQGVKKGSDSADVNDLSSAANGGDGTPTTSALVQTLSSVLNQASTATKREEDKSIEGNLKNALQMLLDVAARNQTASTDPAGNKVVEETVQNQVPEKAVDAEEPASKRQCTYTAAIDEQIRTATQVSDNAEQLLSSVRVAVEDRLLQHVQGWPTEQMEKQANRLGDENHQFVVTHTSELCATMKVARSQVRSAEIHSTLQEQRILYLRQQIKDLEKSTSIAPFT